MTLIYKISPRAAWRAAEDAGVYTGAPVDLADGFIHFSAADQVRATAQSTLPASRIWCLPPSTRKPLATRSGGSRRAAERSSHIFTAIFR